MLEDDFNAFVKQIADISKENKFRELLEEVSKILYASQKDGVDANMIIELIEKHYKFTDIIAVQGAIRNDQNQHFGAINVKSQFVPATFI